MKTKRNKSFLNQLMDTAVSLINAFLQDKNAPIEMKIEILKILSFMEVIMSKEQLKKATFKDLIAKKLKKEEDQFKTKDIYVSSMDSVLTFKKPKDDLILDIVDEIGQGEDTRKMVGAFKKLIYLCCDMLQDTELHKELEVADPFDTVEKIFDLADIMEIGEQLMDLINIGGKAEEIKN